MAYQAVRWPKQMRTKIVGALGEHWPDGVQHIVDYYAGICEEHGRPILTFKIDGMPRSLNHMYGRSARGGKIVTWRKKDVDEFRERVILNMREKRKKWDPSGPCAAVILFETPLWITKTRQIRQMDADNRIKVLMDAIEVATDVPDEVYWNLHVFKVASKRQRTTVFLFDLGDVVEYFY